MPDKFTVIQQTVSSKQTIQTVSATGMRGQRRREGIRAGCVEAIRPALDTESTRHRATHTA